MSGYPKHWQVRTRNRAYSNQPGSLAKPETEMARDFAPNDPKSEHMLMIVDELRREPSIEVAMDYELSNQPEDNT